MLQNNWDIRFCVETQIKSQEPKAHVLVHCAHI